FILSLHLISCSKDSGGDVAIGGSLNKFTIIGNNLYVINNAKVETYDIDNGKMHYIGSTTIEPGIETLFPFDTLILVGAQNGMHICKKNQDGTLTLMSRYTHIQSCDPVVTDGSIAYVTLSSGCGNESNQLEVLNITDPYNPQRIKSYAMNHPKGLGIDGKLLFICDSDDGLKIFDRTVPEKLVQLYHFDYFTAIDVIPFNGLLLVMTGNGFREFNYSDAENIHELSEFTFK
ncbi:MAG TPA: hypothetical protein PLU49_14720, partial [Saprospiraceae bacterium]|nr:hypothetical protein [Saprospiraceae bacterium]